VPVPGFEVWATSDQLAPHESYGSTVAILLRIAAEAATHDSATCASRAAYLGLRSGDQPELAYHQATVQAKSRCGGMTQRLPDAIGNAA